MNNILLYCRPGFEKTCAQEIQARAAALESYGYPVTREESGYVLYHCHQDGEADRLARELNFQQLIFARQMLVVGEAIDLPAADRISAILPEAEKLPVAGELRLETADTNAAKELSRFCRKFTVPLRQALRKAGRLAEKETSAKPVLHLFMQSGTRALLGYSYPDNNSPFHRGIPRLKFPRQAPSRSTLKLDEAILLFLGDQQAKRMAAGMHAVDLGACPGGWTFQLVRRGLFVQAVDNGPMDDELMATGQVEHFREDGFKYQPKAGNVTWLVCDMVEKPSRVAALMADWLCQGWATEAIFNLKLPMKQRFDEVESNLALIKERFARQRIRYALAAKQLYHDREEITVYLRRLA